MTSQASARGTSRQEEAGRPNRAVPDSVKTRYNVETQTLANILETYLVSSVATQRRQHQRNLAILQTPHNVNRTGEKAQKEAGNEHAVKKKKTHVEEHVDDCGEDLSSLTGASLAVQQWMDATPQTYRLDHMDDDSDKEESPACTGIDLLMLYGCNWTRSMSTLQSVHLTSIAQDKE